MESVTVTASGKHTTAIMIALFPPNSLPQSVITKIGGRNGSIMAETRATRKPCEKTNNATKTWNIAIFSRKFLTTAHLALAVLLINTVSAWDNLHFLSALGGR